MRISDYVFLWLLAFLMLAVMAVEYCKRRNLPASVQTPPGGKLLTWQLAVPRHRGNSDVVDDVGYMDVTDAAAGEFA